MARLDRLATGKAIAQMGAALGREFSYELVHAVSPVEEGALQQGLRQLVEAELIYQHGLLPHATYFFKHALVQDTAYQSLLKSTRQQYHQRIAHVAEFAQQPSAEDGFAWALPLGVEATDHENQTKRFQKDFVAAHPVGRSRFCGFSSRMRACRVVSRGRGYPGDDEDGRKTGREA
jgi:hypothetical protein